MLDLDVDMLRARQDWSARVRRSAWRTAVTGALLVVLIQLIELVRVVPWWAPSALPDRGLEQVRWVAARWDLAAGISEEDALILVTALVVLVATLGSPPAPATGLRPSG